MADDAFKKVPFSKLDTNTKNVIAANAASRGVTPQQYYESRGGVNKSGYYGDSYTPGVTLNDAEYAAAIQNAARAGRTGTDIGAAINIASREKAAEYYIANPDKLPNTALSQALSGGRITQAQFENLIRQGYAQADAAETMRAINTGQIQQSPVGVTADGRYIYGYDNAGKPILTPSNISISTGAPATTSSNIPIVTPSPTSVVPQPVVTQPVTFETLTPTRRGIFDVLADRFNQYGLGSLVPRIRELIVNGATEDTITIQLQESPEYQRRFRANQDRIKKGLAVLTPGEYLNTEDSYRQILRAYGLTQFDNDDYVSQFIANDISAAELSSRVVNAVQRVRNADPAISKTLRDFYGIGQNDLVAYVLDPNQQLPKIERQIAAAEIGTAARRQGIEAGVGVAEQLAAQGITQAEAQRGYATIADILPTAEKLSQIYSGVEEGYDLAQAEQEVFNTLASAQRRRQRLTQRELAAFSGESGLGRTSLTQQTGGQF